MMRSFFRLAFGLAFVRFVSVPCSITLSQEVVTNPLRDVLDQRVETAAIYRRARSVVLRHSEFAIQSRSNNAVVVGFRASQNSSNTTSMWLNPRTPALELDELIEATAGTVRKSALAIPIDEYVASNLNSRAGKVFEALAAHQANQTLANLGFSKRIIVTAPEGAPTHPADLILIDRNGVEIKRYQLKAGRKAAWSAIDDPKYTNMAIVTHPEELDELKRELVKKNEQCRRRGISLPDKYRRLKDAIENGSLTDEIIPGQKVPRKKETKEFTGSFIEKRYMEQQAAAGLEDAVTAKGIMRLNSIIRFANYAVTLIDLGMGTYEIYRNIQRYNFGEMDDNIMVAKSLVNGGQLGVSGIGVYLILFPEPTPATKALGTVFFVGSFVLAAADMSLEFANSRRVEMGRQMLERLTTDERYLAVQDQLRQEASRQRLEGSIIRGNKR